MLRFRVRDRANRARANRVSANKAMARDRVSIPRRWCLLQWNAVSIALILMMLLYSTSTHPSLPSLPSRFRSNTRRRRSSRKEKEKKEKKERGGIELKRRELNLLKKLNIQKNHTFDLKKRVFCIFF